MVRRNRAAMGLGWVHSLRLHSSQSGQGCCLTSSRNNVIVCRMHRVRAHVAVFARACSCFCSVLLDYLAYSLVSESAYLAGLTTFIRSLFSPISHTSLVFCFVLVFKYSTFLSYTLV